MSEGRPVDLKDVIYVKNQNSYTFNYDDYFGTTVICKKNKTYKHTLQDLLVYDKDLKKIFQNYLRNTHAEENILFYDAVRKYNKCTSNEERKQTGEQIMERFVPSEKGTILNLEGSVTKKLIASADLSKFTPGLFDSALQSVVSLMSTDSYFHFVKTPEFQEAISERRLFLKQILHDSPESFKVFLPQEIRESLFLWFAIDHLLKNQKDVHEKRKDIVEEISKRYLKPVGMACVCLPMVLVETLTGEGMVENDELWKTVKDYIFDYLVARYAGNFMVTEKYKKKTSKPPLYLRSPSAPDVPKFQPYQAQTKIPLATLQQHFLLLYVKAFDTAFTATTPFVDHSAHLTFNSVPKLVFEALFSTPFAQVVENGEEGVTAVVDTITGIRAVFGEFYRKDNVWVIVPPARITWEAESTSLCVELFYNSLT